MLIIEARYYEEISDELAAGAIAELEARGQATSASSCRAPWRFRRCWRRRLLPAIVPRAAPIGALLRCVALGCVIRGETSHYDIVCNNANHWMMEVAISHAIPVGNGILTVDTEEQAMARARGGREGKGGDAVRACMRADRVVPRVSGTRRMTASARRRSSKSSGNARSAARMATVQALYQMDVAGTDIDEVIEEFVSLRFGQDGEDEVVRGADPVFFSDILRGVFAASAKSIPMVDQALATGWRLVRVDSILRAILRAGVVELTGAAGRAGSRRHQRIHQRRARLLRRRGAEGRQRHPRPAGPPPSPGRVRAARCGRREGCRCRHPGTVG